MFISELPVGLWVNPGWLKTPEGSTWNPLRIVPNFARMTATITSIALSAMLLTSHRQMPNIILQRDERRDVVAYILGLSK
jgi:hypothetical protein